MIILLLIPAILVSNIISERSGRQREVAREVSDKWADGQTVTGPILVVPYWGLDVEEAGNAGKYETAPVYGTARKVKKLCYILPERLSADGVLVPQIRKRSIFKIAVYQADLNVSGSFAPADFAKMGLDPADVLLDEAQICLGLSDFRGIEEQMNVVWDSQPLAMSAGMVRNEAIASGLSAPVSFAPGSPHSFSIKVSVRGSEYLSLIPVGKTTEVKLASTWTDPSFSGRFLPNNPAEVSEKGFLAEWKILDLNRNYPQAWTESENTYDISESAFGVTLLQSADSYAKTQRSVKYAVLFIALTFVLYFLLEVIQRRNVHPLQYVLVGLALCLFYVLLLSISEYTGFNWAYLVASAATIALIAWYSDGMFKKRSVTLLLAGVLGLLYGFIFILLQLQDGALLFGSIGLFILLAAIMYYSRKIDWQTEDIPLDTPPADK